MKIIYEEEKPMEDIIIETVREAWRQRKKIEKIILTPNEFYKLEYEVSSKLLMFYPNTPEYKKSDKFTYMGVSIEREKI